MSTGKKYSFLQLYTESKIKIPQIQRDYVQGRNNKNVATNRAGLVRELVDAVKNNKQLMLNFIYGYYQNGWFVPIDGQQRLTTLLLFHYYVFCKANMELELKFSYETRYTTDRFLEGLFDHKDVCTSGCIDEKIEDSDWFSLNWKSDPSVFSCLAMLKEIQSAFGTEDNNWEKYADALANNSPISFMLLEMKKNELGKPNQLYIRMNSRGKQLNNFENLKADLYGYINEYGSDELKAWKDKNKANIDGRWLDVIWSIPENIEKKEALRFSDTYYLDLFHWMFVNAMIGNSSKVIDDEEWIRPKSEFIDINSTYFEQYIELLQESDQKTNELLLDFLDCFSACLTELSELKDSEDSKAVYKSIISEIKYGNNSKGKPIYTTSISEYKTRLLLYSIAIFRERWVKDNDDNRNFKEDFAAWYRVIRNLVRNTTIDKPNLYMVACAGINKFNFREFFNNNILEIEGFSDTQIKEERLKLQILNAGASTWKVHIEAAEEVEYFQGEINFIFQMLNIKEAADATHEKAEEFKNYLTVIQKVIEFAKVNDNLFHRVLLTYGDYSVCVDGDNRRRYFRYNEPHHNQDWRGMLRNEQGKGFNCFKNFVEACMSSSESSVEIIADAAINKYKKENDNFDSNEDELRYYLISIPDLFDYCKNYYYIWHDTDEGWDRYLLMKNSVRNAYAEYKTYAYAAMHGSLNRFTEGKKPWDAEARRSYVTVNGKTYEYRKDYFIDSKEVSIKDSNGKPVKFIKDLPE